MIAGACWDFIERRGLSLQSSLFILQLAQSWKHTYAEKSHIVNKIPFLFFGGGEQFMLFLGPRKIHFSAQRWNEAKQRATNWLNRWQEGSLGGDCCFAAPPHGAPARQSGPGPRRCPPCPPVPPSTQPQEHLGGHQDPLESRSETGSSVTSGTHWQNLKRLGIWWV